MLTRGLFAIAMFAGSVQACLVAVPTAPMTSPFPAVEERAPQVECVNGFSKDYCNGLVYPGHQTPSACPTPIPEGSCRTLRIFGATFDISTFSNNQPCTGHTLCDETRNGRLKVSSNFTIRLHPNCPYRGCWDGEYAEFTFENNGGVYRGTLMGTIGVGTHRPSTAPSICAVNPGTRDCEKCYDVSFENSTSLWRIGYEATFHGVRADADTGEELCFSLSGDFLISGTGTTGPNFASTWRVAGTADGIHLTVCP